MRVRRVEKRLIHMGDETIAAARNGLNKTRVVGRVAKDFAQAHDCVIQAVIEVDKSVALPKPAAEFVAGDHLPRFFQKDGQHLEGLFRKLESHAVLAKFGSLEIDLKDAEAHDSD